MVELLGVWNGNASRMAAYQITFLTSNEDFAKTSRQRALQIFDVSTNKLKIDKLASVMEMEEFVKSTYTLEGDGI